MWAKESSRARTRFTLRRLTSCGRGGRSCRLGQRIFRVGIQIGPELVRRDTEVSGRRDLENVLGPHGAACEPLPDGRLRHARGAQPEGRLRLPRLVKVLRKFQDADISPATSKFQQPGCLTRRTANISCANMPARRRTMTAADRLAAERVRELWKEYKKKNPGVSQETAAETAGMGQSAFSQFLVGRVPMRVSPIRKFAKLFGVTPASIRDDLADLPYERSRKTTSLNAEEPGQLSAEALQYAKLFSTLTPQTREFLREQLFIYSLIDKKYPWLRRGRPKGESYDQFEQSAVHNNELRLEMEVQRRVKAAKR